MTGESLRQHRQVCIRCFAFHSKFSILGGLYVVTCRVQVKVIGRFPHLPYASPIIPAEVKAAHLSGSGHVDYVAPQIRTHKLLHLCTVALER